MPKLKPVVLTSFSSADQQEARDLILEGLGEHWGWIDETLNPDLVDIADSYSQGLFLVARCEGRLVGTGAFKPHSDDTVEIVRMSVDKDCRKLGIGRLILESLCEAAKQRGYKRVILETTATWDEVIAFYLGRGFTITHQKDGDVYFERQLAG